MRMTERKKQAQATRARIQRAAFELFKEHGYENVSMQEIAERAGCTAGNLYHYFKNKDALVLQFTDHVDSVYDNLFHALPQGWTAIERFECFVRQAILESNNEEVVPMGFAFALRHPEIGTMDFKDDRPFFKYLTELVDDCKAEGSIDSRHDTKDVIRKILVIQRGILFQWRVEREGFEIESVIDDLVSGLIMSLK